MIMRYFITADLNIFFKRASALNWSKRLSFCAGCELSGEAGPHREEAGSSEPRHGCWSPGQAGLRPLPAGPQQRVRTQQLSHGQVLLTAVQSVEARIPPNTDQRPDQRRESPQQRCFFKRLWTNMGLILIVFDEILSFKIVFFLIMWSVLLVVVTDQDVQTSLKPPPPQRCVVEQGDMFLCHVLQILQRKW